MTLKIHDGRPVLVEVLCKVTRCRRLLDWVVSAPPADDEPRWAGYVCVSLCPRHGDGAGHGDVARWQERQRRAGKTTGSVQTGRWVPWAELRPAVEEARRTGRTEQLLM